MMMMNEIIKKNEINETRCCFGFLFSYINGFVLLCFCFVAFVLLLLLLLFINCGLGCASKSQ